MSKIGIAYEQLSKNEMMNISGISVDKSNSCVTMTATATLPPVTWTVTPVTVIPVTLPFTVTV